MKKFLSLVLALTMALSLVTVSAGATDFDDDGDITYQEAVTVIAGMGIVDGYSDGSFRPDDVLTRGAAAKIICNLILGPTTADALSASSAPFVDVPTTNTFAGYITYCSQQGIISGYADGTFRPTDTLSGNAFMKMLLGALGYDSEREGYTGSNWTVNVIKQAVGIELNDGNDDFVGSQAVTREEACLYAFNTLKATMVEYSDNSTVTVGDITITGQGDYSDVTNSTSSDGNIEDDGLMQFAERYFRDLEAEDDTDDEADESVAFVEVYNYLASTVSSGYFDAISFADAVVIDTRSSSDRNDDVYDNEINTASKLSTAIDRIMDDDIEDGEVVADVYVQDGEIVFVAVTGMTNADGDEDGGENQNVAFDEVVMDEQGNVTFYDDDEQVTPTGDHDWELYRYTSGYGWQLYRSGDDYVYGEANPWKLRDGEEYYVVIDGVESDSVVAEIE